MTKTQSKQAREAAQRKIVEAVARHTAWLHRAATAQVNDVNEIIDKSGETLARLLNDRLDNLTPAELKAFTQGKYATSRLKGLRKELDKWTKALASEVTQASFDGFEKLAGYEASYARDTLAGAIEDELPKAPTAAAAMKAAKDSPVLGQMLDELVSDVTGPVKKRVYATMRQGISEGQTNQQIVRALRGTKALNYKDGALQTTRVAAERMVRTGRNHVSNTAYDETYQALGVDEVVDVATLDGRTSAYCASIDGRRHKVGTAHPTPPYHPNCRTMQAPSLDGDVMGKRPYVKAFKPVGKVPKSERPKNMTGQVSAKTTYSDWFARQPASFQREWLGDKRYKLYRDGGYTIDKFVDPVRGKLTLDELRAKDRETFKEIFG